MPNEMRLWTDQDTHFLRMCVCVQHLSFTLFCMLPLKDRGNEALNYLSNSCEFVCHLLMSFGLSQYHQYILLCFSQYLRVSEFW